jgi:hypothetical protein
VAAFAAANADEAPGENPAVRRELPLDAAGQRPTVLAALAGLREEGGQVLLDHLLEDRLPGAVLVAGRNRATLLAGRAPDGRSARERR